MDSDKFMYNAYEHQSAHINLEYTRTSGGLLGRLGQPGKVFVFCYGLVRFFMALGQSGRARHGLAPGGLAAGWGATASRCPSLLLGCVFAMAKRNV